MGSGICGWNLPPWQCPYWPLTTPGLTMDLFFAELDFREELADGFTCAMNRYKREERQGRDTVQCLSEVRGDPHP